MSFGQLIKTFTSSDFTLFVLVILHLSHYSHRAAPPPCIFTLLCPWVGTYFSVVLALLSAGLANGKCDGGEGDTEWGKRESSSHSLPAWDLRLPLAVIPLQQLWAGSPLSRLVLTKPSGRGRSRYSFQFLLIPGQPQHPLLVPLNLPTLL